MDISVPFKSRTSGLPSLLLAISLFLRVNTVLYSIIRFCTPISSIPILAGIGSVVFELSCKYSFMYCAMFSWFSTLNPSVSSMLELCRYKALSEAISVSLFFFL